MKLKALRKLEDPNHQVEISNVENYLRSVGIEEVVQRTHRGRELHYYLGNTAVFAVVPLPNDEGKDFVLIDRSFYDQYLKDGVGSICFGMNATVRRPRYISEQYNFSGLLYVMVLKANSIEYDEVHTQVDHIHNCVNLNMLQDLRVVTPSQNGQNKRAVYLAREAAANQLDENGKPKRIVVIKDEDLPYQYNKDADYSKTWLGYVLVNVVEGRDAEFFMWCYNRIVGVC